MTHMLSLWQMTSAWTNMGFGIHRDVEGEQEIIGWSNGFIKCNGGPCSLFGAMHLQNLRKHWRSKNMSNRYQPWSHLEHMSYGAYGASLTSRIALLVCFMVLALTCFSYCHIYRMKMKSTAPQITHVCVHFYIIFIYSNVCICNWVCSVSLSRVIKQIRNEQPFFSYHLCWQPTCRYQRT